VRIEKVLLLLLHFQKFLETLGVEGKSSWEMMN
jgi:hypothetical protein